MKDEGGRMKITLVAEAFILHPSSFILSFGAEGEVRTLEVSLEDSHVASYITSANVKQAVSLRTTLNAIRRGPQTNSLLYRAGTPGRIRTRNLDVRSVALFQLSYRSLTTVQSLTSKVQSLCFDLDLGLWTFDFGLLDWSIVPDSNRCLSEGNAAS
jgi:hypothetical protein